MRLKNIFLATAVLLTPLIPDAGAQTAAPAPITVTGSTGTSPDLLAKIDGGISAVNQTFSSIDSAIAMLQNLVKVGSFVPGIGALLQLLTPIINTYLDLKTTFAPIMDTVNRGRQFVADTMNAGENLKRIFSSGNLNDSMANINNLVTQFGGLSQLAGSDRRLDSRNVRTGMQKILAAADQQIQLATRQADAARVAKNLTSYRYHLRRVEDLKVLRARLRQSGEMAAAQQDNANLTARQNQVAKAMADRTESQAMMFRTVQSAEGALKLLGTTALDQMNVTAAGFDTLSQQLAILSQQQTITNEQSNQLLAHYEAQEREKNANVKMVIEQDEARRVEQYKSMVNQSHSLGNGIRSTFAPSGTRKSDVASLMKGQVH